MEPLSTCRDSVSETCSDNLELVHLSRNTNVEDQLEKELGYIRLESLSIDDDKKSSEVDNGDDIIGDGLNNLIGEMRCDHRSLSQSATFPSSDKMSSSCNDFTVAKKIQLKENQNNLGMNAASSRSTSLSSLPNPIKLVSAMKGGREKNGIPPQRLSVSWTPDVYDPTPTIVSHTVRNKKQQKSSKKKGRTRIRQAKAHAAGAVAKTRNCFVELPEVLISATTDRWISLQGPQIQINTLVCSLLAVLTRTVVTVS